ncbi:class I SAM-dependent DNA methyltransferase [Cerasicoccus arenae]|uniref:Methyltransferase n=1 Tax=Cerasicoccus arenae TaxID=424488 RepID=A0A8J3DHB2_9BACT|nr:class I SAM-dependent methyltransferase [Cerasicoccus arenae]MBK1856702.1 class I SAM-dependent methyltransferase [Cerasicoccus arenae]GHB99012.1 methyltransferase [Cerasicoccus arenae]
MSENDLMIANKNQHMYDCYGAAYHAKRGREADSSWNRYLDQPMIEALFDGLAAGRVVDLGCGSGLMTRWLRDQGHIAVGVDFSETLIDIARTENPDLDFSVANIKATPYPASSFDIAVSALVLHYEQDLGPIFAEVARVLRPNSRFIFTMHHPVDEVSHSHERLSNARTITPYFHNKPYTFDMAGMQLTAYHHTFENISEALFANGFVIERIREARMLDTVKDHFPDYYERTNNYPSFVGFRARLFAQ